MRNMLLSLDIFRNRQHPVEPLIPPLDVMVTLGGRRLGDIDGVGGRKGLFQPLRQGFVSRRFSARSCEPASILEILRGPVMA